MIIIPPLGITDAVLTSSNVPETDYAAWSAVTAYVAGNRVIVTATGVHRNYECLVGHTNKYPPDNLTGATPYWLDLGADNRWRMFDKMVGNVTSQTTNITVELTPGQVVNSIALFGLSGSSLNIVMDDPVAGEVYNQTVALTESPDVVDWYTYFFSAFSTTTEVVKRDLPSYGAAVITVSIDSTGNAECGHLVIGLEKQLGVTVFGTSVGILDYSRKETDDFGNAIIVQRKFAQTVEYDVRINSNSVREVQRTLAALRTSPVVWIGSDIYPSTVVWGWYKDFSIVISNPSLSEATISVEEFR